MLKIVLAIVFLMGYEVMNKIFSFGGIGPEILDLGIFSDLCTFLEWQKHKIHNENSFNVYSNLKSTR